MSACTPMLEDPSDNICEGKFSQIERLETYLPGSLTPPTFLPLLSNTATPELAIWTLCFREHNLQKQGGIVRLFPTLHLIKVHSSNGMQ